jgi:hypothetical protein
MVAHLFICGAKCKMQQMQRVADAVQKFPRNFSQKHDLKKRNDK